MSQDIKREEEEEEEETFRIRLTDFLLLGLRVFQFALLTYLSTAITLFIRFLPKVTVIIRLFLYFALYKTFPVSYQALSPDLPSPNPVVSKLTWATMLLSVLS